MTSKRTIREYGSASISKIPTPLRFALILVAIGVVSHWQWFVPGFQFRWGDSGGIPSAAFPQYGVSYVGWLSFTGLGGINVQPYQFMFLQTWHILSALGVNFSTTEQLTMLWPIAILSFLSPFLLIRRILKSDLGGFVGALVYGFSTSFLVFQGYEIFLALAFSLLPLVIFAMDVFLVRRSWNSLVAFVVSFSVLCYIEIRVAFLAVLLLVWYLLFGHFVGRRLPNIWKALVGVGLFVVLNAFWVVEAFGVSRSSIVGVTARGVFGNNFTNFAHALTLVSGSWANGSIVPFSLGPIAPVMWLLPILAIAGALMKGSADTFPRWAVCTFAGTIAIAGVMLGTQANPPFSSLFPWVFNHVPGFSLFRVGADFLIIASLGYGILIGRLFSTRTWSAEDFKRLTYKTLYPIGLAAVVVTLFIPLVDGRVGSLFVHRSQPSGFSRVESFVDDQKGFFRTLWLPEVPNWSTFSLSHPAVGGVDLLDSGQPLTFTVTYGTATGAATLHQLGTVVGQKVLQEYSVRYLILPPPDSANLGPLYASYGEPRTFYLKWLESRPWLQQISGFGDGYSVFQVIDSKSRGLISVAGDESNTTSYVVNSGLLVAGLSEAPKSGSTVSVSMLYNPNWRAYLVPLKELSDVCQIKEGKVQSCGVGSAYRLLLDSGSGIQKSLSIEQGPKGQLQFRLPGTASKKGTEKMAIVMVFGSALETWSLFYLAQVIIVLLVLFVLVRAFFRSRRCRTTTIDPLAEADSSAS